MHTTFLSRRRPVPWIPLLAAALLIVTPRVPDAQAASRAGFVLLGETVGARAAAMGDASTAVTGDQPSVHTNPAGAALLTRKDFVLSHHRSLAGIHRAYAGWATGNGTRGIGLMLGVHSTGGLQARTGPSAQPLGTFGFHEINTGLTYSQRLGGRMYAGASVRAVHEAIAGNRTWGVAVDVGLLLRTPVPGLDLGASVQNLGRTGRLGAERIRLPLAYRIGAALRKGAGTLAVDGRFPQDGDAALHAGAEYAVSDILFLRAGVQTGSDVRAGSFGLGLKRGNWRIAYAFVPSKLDLDGTHRIALGIR